MPLTVKWDKGISIEYGDSRIVFDPQSKSFSHSTAFLTHAHLDHSKGLSASGVQKLSTKESRDLLRVYGREVQEWKRVTYGQRIKMDDIEVVAHNAGHVLGSALYEVVSPEGTVVYTGDFQFRDAFTTKAAEAVSCDILVLEATFGLPSFHFPQRDAIATEMIHWAVDSVKRGEIPVFQTDPLGNAQEIIHIFNTLTTLPVIAHRRVAQISRVYDRYGHSLEVLDARLEENTHVASSKECVFVVPKNSKLTEHSEFNTALVSGWALWSRGVRKAFALSDHADFPQLIEFVATCKPKTVLTCMGGRFNKSLADQIEKRLGIEARPLKLIPTTHISRDSTCL
jgi:putative mRNA 3-end processing factor